jgi:protein-tyrosine-phosphatase
MSTILFLCPHGAAKSILAAAYCQRLAAERGLEVRAVAAGTEPDPDVAPAVARALLEEGIDVRGHRPRRVAPEELTGAWRVVSLGCELGDLAPPGLVVDRWDDVPSPSAQLEAARGLIAARLPRLLDEYERAGRDPDGSR